VDSSSCLKEPCSFSSNNIPTVSDDAVVLYASVPISITPVLIKSDRGNVDNSESDGPPPSSSERRIPSCLMSTGKNVGMTPIFLLWCAS
jgi:hypothetical protein